MKTLVDVFRNAVRSNKASLLLRQAGDEWKAISASEFDRTVRALAAALARAGIRRGDRVALLSVDQPEWSIVDFATVCRGGVLVPIYTSYEAPQAEELLKDSGARVAFVDTRQNLEKILAGRARCPELEQVVLLEGAVRPGENVLAYADVLRSGAEHMRDHAAEIEADMDRVVPDDLATLIYTSGTTGVPKGAMLTHGNFVSDIEASRQHLATGPEDVALSFLPLAHVFERMLAYSYFRGQTTIAYLPDHDRLAEALQAVRPSIFGAVPRVYEKIRDRVNEAIDRSSPVKRRLFAAAMSAGATVVRRREEGRGIPPLLRLRYRLFDKIVFAKIRARLGGRFRYSVSGGAPLGRDLAEFFWAAGVSVFEGYGLTETSPVISVNHPGAWRLGSVGRPIPGIDVTTGEDGEILVRGPIVMKGYWNKPRETADVFTNGRWFHTGDIGRLDADGFLFITDRKKEILVSAYGKNIAPAPIEAALAATRYVATAVLIGDRRKFVSALIVPDFSRLDAWAAEQGLRFASREQMCRNDRVRALYQNAIDLLNADQPHEHQIRKFTLLPREFTIESGELTPTLKVKRRVLAEKYRGVIDAMYETEGEGAGNEPGPARRAGPGKA